MALNTLVRSVGPTPVGASNYYTNWTQFFAGFPKFKNQGDVTSVENNGVIISARGTYEYFTGRIIQSGASSFPEIITRTVIFLPDQIPPDGQYYDIPVDAYQTGGTGLSPNAGASQNTSHPNQDPEPPPGPATIDVVVTESFALSTGDTRVTPWHMPQFVQERELQANRWANLSAVKEAGGAIASVAMSGEMPAQILAQDFGFRLPSGAQVVGVEVEVMRRIRNGVAQNKAPIVLVNGGVATYYSEDWSNFDVVAGAANSVTFANGLFVACGNSQTLRISSDGRVWTDKTPSGVEATWTTRQATYGNGVWVCGVNEITRNSVLRSTDNGASWARVALPGTAVSPIQFYASTVTDGAGTWIVGSTGSTSKIFRSADNGASWSDAGSPVAGNFSGSVWTGSYFMGVWVTDTSVTVARSTNGAAWTELTNIEINRPPAGWYGIISLVGSRVVLFDNYYSASPLKVWYTDNSGDTWTQVTFSAAVEAQLLDGDPFQVLFDSARGRYVFGGGYYENTWPTLFETDTSFGNLRFLRSVDVRNGDIQPFDFYHAAVGTALPAKTGLNTEEVLLLAGGRGEPLVSLGLIADEGAAVVGGTYRYDLVGLFDGVPPGDPAAWQAAVYGRSDRTGTRGDSDNFFQEWTSEQVNDPSFGVSYRGRGTQGLLEVDHLRARIYYRADLTNDTLPAKRAKGLAGVAESPGGIKVAVGVDGKILRKPANNPTWSTVASGTTVSLNAVEWVGDRFIAVGVGGIALDGGADGTAWTRIETGAVASLWAIRRIPDTLRAIAVGNDDYAFERSRQGVWSK